MDSTLLRIILLVLGIALVAGIYFWDRSRHVDSRLQRKREKRIKPQHDSSVFDEKLEEDEIPDELISMKAESTPEENISFDIPEAVSMPEPDLDEDLSFSAKSAFEEFEAGAELPTKILQINIHAKGHISGQMILDLTNELGLEHGEFNIYHRMDQRTGKSVFSMANMVEPGTFEPDNMQDFKTPGLALFAQLPAPIDPMKAYNDMLEVAERISFIVGAEMQDETHSVMTKQSVEHTRDEIMDYQRKLKLAMQTA